MKNLVKAALTGFPYSKRLILKTGIFMICAFVFYSCTAYRAERLKNKSYREWKAYQWKQEKRYEENGRTWTTYSRKKEGSHFREFKIVGEISASLDIAVKTLREKTEKSRDYPDNNKGFVNILSSSETEAVVYSVYHMPFPFKDRAMCERFSFEVEENSGIHKISWAEDWTMAPRQKENVINMPVARGSWEFVPVGKHCSLATYTIHADPGGSIPGWIVNSTVAKGLPKEFESIEAIAQKLKLN